MCICLSAIQGMRDIPLAFPTGLSVSAALLLSSAQPAALVWNDLLVFGVSPDFKGLLPDGAPAPFSCNIRSMAALHLFSLAPMRLSQILSDRARTDVCVNANMTQYSRRTAMELLLGYIQLEYNKACRILSCYACTIDIGTGDTLWCRSSL